ncbi:MAG: hypothetical protein HOP28_05805 [Gemmatimonadales bacterium]|nr:hypothetical protein [Gemmatimonadales bacterium]
MRSILTLSLTAVALLGSAGAVSPVGLFRLTTVDGVRVPMVWRQEDGGEGRLVQLHWIAGRAEVRRDGTCQISLTAIRIGHGLTGTPETTTVHGTWRLLPGFKVEFRFAGQPQVSSGPWAPFSQLVVRGKYPDLEGQHQSVTMVLVRD